MAILWIWLGLIVLSSIITALLFRLVSGDWEELLVLAIGGGIIGFLTLPIWIVPWAIWDYATAQDFKNIPQPIIPTKSIKPIVSSQHPTNFKPDIKSRVEANSPQYLFEIKFKSCRYIVENQMVLPNVDDAKDLVGELTIWNGEEVMVLDVSKYTVVVKEAKTGARIEMLWDNLLGWTEALRIEPWKERYGQA